MTRRSRPQSSRPDDGAEIGVKLDLIVLVVLFFGGTLLVPPLLHRTALPAWVVRVLAVVGILTAPVARERLIRRYGQVSTRALVIVAATYLATILGVAAVWYVVRRAAG